MRWSLLVAHVKITKLKTLEKELIPLCHLRIFSLLTLARVPIEADTVRFWLRPSPV